jgi:hypothetical protein
MRFIVTVSTVAVDSVQEKATRLLASAALCL